jgi:hypothetical protein
MIQNGAHNSLPIPFTIYILPTLVAVGARGV